MSFKAGQQVMCVMDFSRSSSEEARWLGTPIIYPKMHEELLIDGVRNGYLRFRKYDQPFSQPISNYATWAPQGFVPIAPIEEAIADLMKVEEPELA